MTPPEMVEIARSNAGAICCYLAAALIFLAALL